MHDLRPIQPARPYVVAFDTETFRIRPGLLAPKLVCLSWHDGTATKLLAREDGLDWLEARLCEPSTILLTQNGAYDFAVCAALRPHLLPLIFAAYEQGRVRDTRIRQKLLDIAVGFHKFHTDWRQDALGKTLRQKTHYGLDQLVWRHYGHVLPKANTFRLRFSELDGVPIEDYPEEARTYAMEDARWTYLVHMAQDAAVVPDEGETVPFLPNELPQTCAAWVLHLMSVWGLRTNKAAAYALRDKYKTVVEAADKRLRAFGMVRPDGTKDMKVIRDTVASCYAARWLEPPTTPGGAVSTDSDTLEAIALTDEEFAAVEHTPAGSWSPEACITVLAHVSEAQHTLTSFVPVVLAGTDVPINPGFNALVESGRTSCEKPNLHNPPRKGGVREAFEPRPGFVYVGADYSTLELRTLAQCCLFIVGYSEMAEAIKRGEDLHASMAAKMRGVDYSEFAARLKAGDKAAEDDRQFAKCFHPDTDILTRLGWKKIADLVKTDEVAVAHPGRLHASLTWERPLRLTRRHADTLVHLRNEGIDLRVTEDHQMLGFSAKGWPKIVTPRELNKCRYWLNAGELAWGTFDKKVDWRILMLAVATQADGSYTTNGSIRFGFTKQRKIARLRTLLLRGEYVETKTRVENGGKPVTSFLLGKTLSRRVREWLDEKKFPWWWVELPPAARELILEEARHWDSHTPPRGVAYSFCSVIAQNVEVLQALAALTGRKSRLVKAKRAKEHHADPYKLTIRSRASTRGENIAYEVIEHNAEVVCLTVSSGFVLVRDGGVPVITHQCGNFGLPGGMGGASLADYAKGYGMQISVQFGKQLQKDWLQAWPEMRGYFRHISAITSTGEGTVFQILSDRVRGGLRYTSAANTYFQGLAADLAKDALWHVSRKCYLGIKPDGTPSPLAGSRPVIFLHDEIILETPYDPLRPERASDAAKRLTQIMEERGRVWCPDVPIEAGAVMMRNWWKGAKAVFDDKGNMLPAKPIKVKNAEGKEQTKWVADV